MVLESTFGVMVMSTKESGNNAFVMDKVVIILRLATPTLANTNMVKLKVSANMCGVTATSTLEFSSMVRKMDKVIGRKTGMKMPTNTKVSIRMIKSTDMESLPGNLVANTKETTMLISRWVMVKCIGMMEPFIEVTGMRDCRMASVS